MEKTEIAEKISNRKINVRKIQIANEKIVGWYIAAKNSRLVNCCEKFWVEKYGKRSEMGEKISRRKVTVKNSGWKMGGKNHKMQWEVLSWKIGVKSFVGKCEKRQLRKKFTVRKLALKIGTVGENILIGEMWKF